MVNFDLVCLPPPVQVDPESRQSVHEVDVNLLLAQKVGHLVEELLECPHLLGIDLEQAGQDGGEVLLDPLAEEAGAGQLPAPLDGAVLHSLHPGDHPARLLRRDVVHCLLSELV